MTSPTNPPPDPPEWERSRDAAWGVVDLDDPTADDDTPPDPPETTPQRSRTVAAAAALLATISIPLAAAAVAAQITSAWYLAIVPAGVATAVVAGRHAQRGSRP